MLCRGFANTLVLSLSVNGHNRLFGRLRASSFIQQVVALSSVTMLCILLLGGTISAAMYFLGMSTEAKGEVFTTDQSVNVSLLLTLELCKVTTNWQC